MPSLILEDGTPNRLHRKLLASRIAESTGLIRIATAYVTERQLLRAATEREIRLLTSLAPMDVASGATSLESLYALIKSGVRCRVLPARPRLHAKVYIFGNSSAAITSANLTSNGLDSNIEVGVETSAGDVTNLVMWFDRLWALGSPVTVEQIAELQRETSALRREFTKLKQRVKSKPKTNRTSKQETVLSDSLQELFDTATRFFVCNTDRRQGDRTPTGGYVLEEEMHNRGFATAWEDFKFPSHMEMVEPGNAIFMFAKGIGIIGVGVAEGSLQRLNSNQRGRLTQVHDTVEWRVPVRWLAWTDSIGAFQWKSPYFTFWDVSESQYDQFRTDVMAHFLDDK
ncbi:MAG: phospholipase D family protein [Pirellulaceae bacterium]|nr:phospholipase D family protein [Pirellulaceae bacterium]